MLARTDTIATIAESWLAQFERALAAPDDALLKTLFHPDSHWRDVLALTWHIKTVNGSDAILRELRAHAGRARPTGFRIDPHRTAPRNVTRAGTNAIEAIFRFETAEGRGSGVLRLTPDADDGNTLKAWTLLTALDEMKGSRNSSDDRGPQGKAYSRDFRGPNWLDLRNAAAEYADRDPAVLVVGGGQAGLSIAARLTQLQVDTLIVDREAAHRRQLAQALSRAGPAQPGARQPPSLHAVSAELAGLHSQGQARRLVRGLCGEHGAQLLDGHRIRGRQLRRKTRNDGPSCCAGPTARSGRCIRATSSWPPG